MSLLGGDDLKEQQKINELQLKINREKQKLDKKLTRQKILLGAFFLIRQKKKDSVNSLREHTAKRLPEFLYRETDRKISSNLIVAVGGEMLNEKEREDSDDRQRIINETNSDIDNSDVMLQSIPNKIDTLILR